MLVKQLIYLEKMRTENLKNRTDDWDPVMDCWSVTKWMIGYKDRLLKKSSNRKSKLILWTLITTWLSNIAFHLRPIWLQTFVAIDSESRLTSFPRFCVLPPEVAVLFSLNLSKCPQSSIRPAALHMIWSRTCCVFYFHVIFLLRDQWLIEGLSKAIGPFLAGNNCQIPSKNIFHTAKKVTCHCPIFIQH